MLIEMLLQAGWSPLGIVLLYAGAMSAIVGGGFLWLGVQYAVMKGRGEID